MTIGSGNNGGVDAAIRHFAATGAGEKKHSLGETVPIDQRISSQASSVLQEKIQFVPAEKPQQFVSDELKKKYLFVSSKSLKTYKPTSLETDASPVQSHRESAGAESEGISLNIPFGSRESDDQLPSTSQTDSSFNLKRPSSLATEGGLSYSKSDKLGSPVIQSPTRVWDGIPEPQLEICPLSHLPSDWNSFKPHHALGLGLHNVGNTCFLNSVLQILTHTAPLVGFLGKDHHSETCLAKRIGYCPMCELRDHILFVFNTRRSPFPEPVVPVRILQRMRLIMKSYIRGRQEDAHEFLRYLIDAMQTACLVPFRQQKLDMFAKGTTSVSKIFGGYHRNEITCMFCQTKSTTYDPFLDISLEIKHQPSIEDALKHFTKAEILSSENAYKCLHCRRTVRAKKMYTIHRPPMVLTIHLKRFDHFGKIGQHVRFTERLNLRPYMSEKDGPPVVYRLYGVVVHQGNTTHSGHYYAFVRNIHDQFHLMDDSRVSTVSTKNVLNQPGYLLFYARQSTQTAAVKPQARAPPSTSTNFHSPEVKQTSVPVAAKETQRVDPVRPQQEREPIRFSFKVSNGENRAKEEQDQAGLPKLVPYDCDDEDEEDSPKSSKHGSPAPKKKSPDAQEVSKQEEDVLLGKKGSEERKPTSEEHPPDPVVEKPPAFNVFERLKKEQQLKQWSPEEKGEEDGETSEPPRKKKRKKHREAEEEVSSQSSVESETRKPEPNEKIRIKLNLKESTVEQLTPIWRDGEKKRKQDDDTDSKDSSPERKKHKKKKKKHKKKKHHHHHRHHSREQSPDSPHHRH